MLNSEGYSDLNPEEMQLLIPRRVENRLVSKDVELRINTPSYLPIFFVK